MLTLTLLSSRNKTCWRSAISQNAFELLFYFTISFAGAQVCSQAEDSQPTPHPEVLARAVSCALLSLLPAEKLGC